MNAKVGSRRLGGKLNGSCYVVNVVPRRFNSRDTPSGVALTFYKWIHEPGADYKAKVNTYKKWLCPFLGSRHKDQQDKIYLKLKVFRYSFSGIIPMFLQSP